ncbi:MAG: HAMP domain-containing histidine kinase, partial [Anaerolineae bacterium]|nr:HAMP domain-containing histidine kinase [Anaerolineae bacterium]
VQGYHKVIARNSSKMIDIIDALLLIARVREEKEVVTEHPDMAAIVSEVLSRLSNDITVSQAQISVPDRWPDVLGYSPWIEEVWVNYISNAIKYGGIPPRIELGATEQPDGYVRFWIKDNGSGISQEDQSRLFTQFTRLDEAKAEGHGLGLSIVQRIVEKLDGKVGVESAVGQGSTFFFTLPAGDVMK